MSVDGSLSGSLGGIMGVFDGGLEVIVVEMVSVWDGSSLVQRENWSRVWSGSFSPGISSLLGGNSSRSSSFGGIMGILDGSFEVIVVESISIRDSSFLIQRKNWSRVWS